MKNREYKPYILITLDTERQLRLSNNACLFYEEASGKSVTDLDLNSISLKDVSFLVYAGMRAMDSTLTYEKTLELLDEYGNYSELIEKVGEALLTSQFFSTKTDPVTDEKNKKE